MRTRSQIIERDLGSEPKVETGFEKNPMLKRYVRGCNPHFLNENRTREIGCFNGGVPHGRKS